jgi:hypothetical protein
MAKERISEVTTVFIGTIYSRDSMDKERRNDLLQHSALKRELAPPVFYSKCCGLAISL